MIKIGTRKLRNINETSYISIPKIYLENNNLDDGSKFEIFMDSHNHLIMKLKRKVDKL